MTFNEYICSLTNDHTICFQHNAGINNLKISFKRTIRVPDNNEVNYLPPDLGNFPLYKVKDFSDRLPPDMAAKGGVFLPMYQREAMWIDFKAKQPFMIKIYVGGINVVSGENAVENLASTLRRQNLLSEGKSIQDYMVAPNQKWIDGIATTSGTVKQFVAMPVGSGYSVEAQMTGEETVGGLFFEITPSLTLKPVQLLPSGRTKIFVKTLTGKIIALYINLTDTVSDVKCRIQEHEGIPLDQQRLMFAGKDLMDWYTLNHYKVKEDAMLYLILRMRGGGGSTHEVEMAMAAGGSIEQIIVKDNQPPDIWKPELTTTFNVQLLNSFHFQRIVGQAPPKTPITAATYSKLGYPFFKMWEDSSDVHGEFDAVKSIGKIEKKTEPAYDFRVVPIKSSNDTGKSLAKPHVPVQVDDPDGLINKAGPLRDFRTISHLRRELDKLSVATFV